MTVQVLVATMHQEKGDHSLLEKMNIHSAAIIGNQCDRNETETFEYEGHKVQWLSFAERGVGLNRNNALMRADADIVLFADDDVVYCDDYAEKIASYYEAHPEADVVVFNFRKRRGEEDYRDVVKKEGKVRRRNATRYGTYCITARTRRLHWANVFFHLQFGGGAKYSNGEDTLFLQDCIKRGLRVYATKTKIGVLDHGESTWFHGYTDKYFRDKGVLYYAMDHSLCRLFALYHCVKHRKKYGDYGWQKAFRQMCAGIRNVSKRK